ncbi:MAG TPA: polysaccharide biosynthesis/export family protein [Steroidobacteraceae bacterium]|jgi:polysaccharide export outer membrane protein|nr:polysaccharide biosynthesis/export family protein [Steroidobacteraceae bacterium]
MTRLFGAAGWCRVACTMLSLSLLGWLPQARAQQLPDYTINAGDTLDIAVWKEEDLTKKDVIVRPDGKFSFPLAGQVVAAGRTVAQVEAEIGTRLKPYIPEPVVAVAVKNLDGCRIYVIGQVSKAGSFVMNPRVNVLQALSLAGGLTPFAAANDIMVLRGNGAAQHAIAFHYAEVVKGRNLNQNVLLEAGDVVVVP